jgi:hypothetical protein
MTTLMAFSVKRCESARDGGRGAKGREGQVAVGVGTTSPARFRGIPREGNARAAAAATAIRAETRAIISLAVFTNDRARERARATIAWEGNDAMPPRAACAKKDAPRTSRSS